MAGWWWVCAYLEWLPIRVVEYLLNSSAQCTQTDGRGGTIKRGVEDKMTRRRRRRPRKWRAEGKVTQKVDTHTQSSYVCSVMMNQSTKLIMISARTTFPSSPRSLDEWVTKVNESEWVSSTHLALTLIKPTTSSLLTYKRNTRSWGSRLDSPSSSSSSHSRIRNRRIQRLPVEAACHLEHPLVEINTY